MIYPYVGDYLISPVPLQLSFNYCSHKCSYCFANLNKPGRTFDVKAFYDQVKAAFNTDKNGQYTNHALQSVLLREKYPVLISNLVDPFATSNYQQAVPAMEMLTNMGVPVALQTRGGRGVDDVLKFLPRSVWYVSIPMWDDAIRRRVEPAAPSINDRLGLIEELRNKGHEVVVGVNPTVSDWLPGNDAEQLLNTIKAYGVRGIWVAAVHFNQKQMKVMPERDKYLIGEAVIKKGLANARDLQQGCFDFINGLKEQAYGLGLEVEGLFEGEENHFFDCYKEVYGKVFPTVHEFINWCWQHKQDGEPVYFDEFVRVLDKWPAGEHNLSPYMMCMSQSLVKEVHYKMSYKKLLWLAWNEPRMKRQLNRYWRFAVGVHYNGKNMRYQKDDKGNLVYYFHRDTFDEDYYIVK